MNRYIYRYEGTLPLEAGGVLENLEICYHASAPAPGSRRVIWVTHALTANSDPSEWWDTLVGPGLFFDTDEYFIICANMLGSCYGTRALWKETPGMTPHPAESSDPLAEAFPLITVRDMVSAHELLRDHLGIGEIDLLIGSSSGGFQAVEWAVMHPSRIKNLCMLACNARISPCGTAWEESQRMAMRADASFVRYCHEVAEKRKAGEGIRIGENRVLEGEKVPGLEGMSAARSIALISYRSFEGYGLTQAEKGEEILMARRAATYQQHQGQKLAARFDPWSYYMIADTVDTHNVGRGRGGVKAALSRITARVMCIGIDSDGLFPVKESVEMARGCTGTTAAVEVISSEFGHDGFLLEYAQISEVLGRWCPWLNQKNKKQ